LAQALATQAAILPPPYQKLAKLLDNAVHFDYPTVQQVCLLLPFLCHLVT
jgi:predicted unusual protein kinase regulating ubiquinone biosynthesis (AarF/ABC1/UbiB family)